MKKYLLLVFLLFSKSAIASEGFMGFGVGVFNSAKYSKGEVKMGYLGKRYDIFNGIYWQVKGGYWGDGSPDRTRRGSGYVSTGPGLLIDLKPLEMRAGFGLAGITTPDSYLGGRFQFNEEMYVGLRDRRGNGIGLQYDHLSSAGLEMPNIGRDFLTLQISQQF